MDFESANFWLIGIGAQTILFCIGAALNRLSEESSGKIAGNILFVFSVIFFVLSIPTFLGLLIIPLLSVGKRSEDDAALKGERKFFSLILLVIAVIALMVFIIVPLTSIIFSK